MKYILKKDLPFAKAGEIVDFLDGTIEAKSCQCDVPSLFVNIWIEEVKPREVYIEFFKDTDDISDAGFDLTYLRNDARFYTKRFIEVTG